MIASQHVAVVPSEKSVSLLPVPPRQDLPPMCVKLVTLSQSHGHMQFQAPNFERLLGAVAV